MGKVNIQGLGTVNIEGDKPNEKEIEVFKRMLAVKDSQNLTEGPAEEVTENFLTSPKFGRILTEAGLAIAGSIATGGLALPGLALRGTMLARPFLTQLAKSSIGAGVGGGTGAAVAQTFDPKEDVIKEILRATTEGALAEAIGAPIVIKGGQVVGKLLGSRNPKKFNDLLDGATEAENALKAKSAEILKDPLKFAEKFKLKTDPKNIEKLKNAAEEMSKGLTPGVKSSNRTLEIIENISQKSLLGGGAITTRYEAAKNIGDLVAKDMLEQYKVVADEADLGKLFFESLGGARGAFDETKNKLYQVVDDILIKNGAKDAQVIPVENTLRSSIDELKKFYSETPMPESIGGTIGIIERNLRDRAGKYSFSQLDKLRKSLVDTRFNVSGKEAQAQVGKLIKTVDDILTDKNLKDVIPEEAVDALGKANTFFREGNDVFTRGIIANMLKKAGEDGLVLGKDAKAIQQVFKTIAGQDNVTTTKALFREIDALTGQNIKAGDGFTAIKGIIDPATNKPMLSVADANKLKDSFRGQFLSNALRASEDGSTQFGNFYNAKKFEDALTKGEGKLKDFLFQGKDKKAIEGLQNTLAFAQGDLSRLPGLPGGIFIQLKQAGAAGQILSLGSVGGAAGVAGIMGGIVPAAGILLAPAIATKIMLNPKFSNLIFRESAKLVAKGENTPSKMGVLYRQIIGRMFTDGLISKDERDDALSQVTNMQRRISQQENQQQAEMNLPNVQPSNFPVINTGGAAAPMGGQSNTELAQALNLFNKGGIVSVRR
jgi:predicted hydrocarbon binding protein